MIILVLHILFFIYSFVRLFSDIMTMPRLVSLSRICYTIAETKTTLLCIIIFHPYLQNYVFSERNFVLICYLIPIFLFSYFCPLR